ncbi:Mce protein [Mycolicibacterium alvei]|uniref:Mce associated membrane protein n=1 Tax=Mycolicibacterium alvei TaxID=67081 RepID=A0A6N4URM2_9MYCO|nr:Mce protein [Mycolicibacterium alvei]MCV7003937.1 Mce protein [Mycolicibacterium alvei]BBX27696.1 hypothetical protein MALV_28210 [Mycolicibacterium alvei]
MQESLAEDGDVDATTDEPTDGSAADTEVDPSGGASGSAQSGWLRYWTSPVAPAMLTGVLIVAVLTGLAGWLGFRTQQSDNEAARRDLFLQVGRQSAVNLTTIDWQSADSDVQRILNGATGSFYDDFANRSQPFIEVVKQARSQSVGTVTAAGIESASADAAQILVSVEVKTSNAGVPEQEPRAWRMRISVQKVDDHAKVSNVEFVA